MTQTTKLPENIIKVYGLYYKSYEETYFDIKSYEMTPSGRNVISYIVNTLGKPITECNFMTDWDETDESFNEVMSHLYDYDEIEDRGFEVAFPDPDDPTIIYDGETNWLGVYKFSDGTLCINLTRDGDGQALIF
jgi:hypothetical protein